jgi:hypothetical protein
MPEQLTKIEMKLVELEGKLDELVASNKKMRTYLLWSIMLPLGLLVLPLLLIPFMLPLLMGYMQTLTLPPGF